jgi:hypothetical protein
LPIKKIATESTRIENLVQKSSQKVLNPILPNTWVPGSTKGFYTQTNHGTQIEWHTPAVPPWPNPNIVYINLHTNKAMKP